MRHIGVTTREALRATGEAERPISPTTCPAVLITPLQTNREQAVQALRQAIVLLLVALLEITTSPALISATVLT